jgi:hypothetical protein
MGDTHSANHDTKRIGELAALTLKFVSEVKAILADLHDGPAPHKPLLLTSYIAETLMEFCPSGEAARLYAAAVALEIK